MVLLLAADESPKLGRTQSHQGVFTDRKGFPVSSFHRATAAIDHRAENSPVYGASRILSAPAVAEGREALV